MNLTTSSSTTTTTSRRSSCCGGTRSMFLLPYAIDLGYDQEPYINSRVEEVSYRPGNSRQARIVAHHPNPENGRRDNHHDNVGNDCIKDMSGIRNILGNLSRHPRHHRHQQEAQYLQDDYWQIDPKISSVILDVVQPLWQAHSNIFVIRIHTLSPYGRIDNVLGDRDCNYSQYHCQKGSKDVLREHYLVFPELCHLVGPPQFAEYRHVNDHGT